MPTEGGDLPAVTWNNDVGLSILGVWGATVAVGATGGLVVAHFPAAAAAAPWMQGGAEALSVTEGAAFAYVNPAIYTQLELQLAREGSSTIFKALRSAREALAEHIGKRQTAQYKSSIDKTIVNVRRQIATLEKFIKDKGLGQ